MSIVENNVLGQTVLVITGTVVRDCTHCTWYPTYPRINAYKVKASIFELLRIYYCIYLEAEIKKAAQHF